MEVLEGIHLISLGGSAEGSAGGPIVSAYFVLGEDCGAFIDAGFPDQHRTQPLLDYWCNALGSPQTEWILVSHRHYEHAGGVKIVKERTGARVAAGQGDVEAINGDFGAGSRVVDRALRGEEVFNLGGRHIRAIATPGHTAGTVCYLLEEDGVLFSGDHIMGLGTVVVRTDEGGTMSQHIDSLGKLLDADVKVILSGHGPAIRDPQVKIQEVIKHRMEREEQFMRLIGEGVNDVEALLIHIYGDVSERLAFLARHQVIAHLAKLKEEGLVVESRTSGTYRLT